MLDSGASLIYYQKKTKCSKLQGQGKMNDLNAKYLELFHTWLETLGTDVKVVLDTLKQDGLASAAKPSLVGSLNYLFKSLDLIPDGVEDIGYLDDAIMVQLVVEQLHHEIEAYEKFCEIRKTKKPDAAAMAKSRSQLQARMRRNRRQERSRRRSRGGGRSPIGLW